MRMDFVLNLIHVSALVFTLVIAPAIYLLSLAFKRQFKDVEYEWKKPQVILFTIISFIINLALFILACFFFAGYYRNVSLDIIQIPPTAMWQLSVDCMLFFMGVTALYVSLQNYFVQFIALQGIIIPAFSWKKIRFQHILIRWQDIRDYYVRTDYPITYYHFILQNSAGEFTKRSLKIPFYALARFESILEINMKRDKELRAHQKSNARKISKNLPHD